MSSLSPEHLRVLIFNMNRLKFFIISLFILTPLWSFHAKQNFPVIIKSQKEIFNKIAKDFKDNLPKDIEILMFNIAPINGSEELIEKINNDFYQALKEKESDYNYSIKSEKEITETNKDIDLTAIKKESELELMALGKYLQLDAILITSLTVIEDSRKKVWNKNTKEWEYKKKALIQGNIFSTATSISLYRFSYFFYL